MFYFIESKDYMKENKLEFPKFMDAYKYQQKHAPKTKIFVTESEKSVKFVKVWDPDWESITFYADDPICPPTKKK